jgi:ribosomal protein L7/L12
VTRDVSSHRSDMISSGANNIIGRCRHARKAGLPLYVARCSSASTDPKPYPAVTIRGTPLPKIVGDHSWAQVELANMGEKMEKGAWIQRMKAHGGQKLITADLYKECPDGVRDLVDELLCLSRFEVQVIMKRLQVRLGITEEMKRKAKLMPYAMPTGEPSPNDPSVLAAAAGAKAGTVAAKDSYDLMLKSYDTTAKIKMIKEVCMYVHALVRGAMFMEAYKVSRNNTF